MGKNSTAVDFEGKHFFVGIDTARKKWSVTIRCEEMELKTFSMNPYPEELVRHLKRHYPGGTYRAVYEAGFGGFWAQRRLNELGCETIVVNPADVPTTDKDKDRKTDPIDSRKLARELSKGNLNAIYVPCEEAQNLRSLSRHLRRCVQSQTRVKNRIKALLNYNGVEYPSATKRLSKGYANWLQELELDNGPGRQTMQYHVEELLEHRTRIAKIIRQIKTYCKKTGRYHIIELLRSVPGVGLRTAITLYCEIIDINRFRKFDHLKSFVGLVPATKSTGGQERTRGITNRSNPFLRQMLIEAAWVAVRWDPGLLQYYSKTVTRMKAQQVIVRVAKKLLNRIRYVWKNEKPYERSLN